MSNNDQITLGPVIRELFSKRGVPSSMIELYLSWNLNRIPDLLTLKDLSKASERIIKAMKSGEKIGVYGDYDVDGTSSCALLFHFFKLLNYDVNLVQPSRFIEGYGIHPPNIDKAVDLGTKVLITVDCGITNNEAASYAKERGLDLIITDHHKDGRDTMPDAFAVVNPNRRDEPTDSPLRHLAGVGVAFALALKIKKDLEEIEKKEVPSIYSLLPFVALGTICDIAYLNPLNLILSRHGLKEMRKSRYIGFQTFLSHEERELDFIPSEKLSFTIGPMINAKGRLDHPEKALLVLTTNDREEAQEAFNHLEIANRERKSIQKEVFNTAKEMILADYSKEMTASVLFKEDWHEGVIGIVASKLVDAFKVPAIVFTSTEDKNIIKASARSAGELDLFVVLKEMEDLYERFGGHKAACGLSMKKGHFPIFKTRLGEILKKIPAIVRTDATTYDLEVAPKDITPMLAKELELLEPFGNGNERPLFKIRGINLDSFDILKEEHVRWSFSDPKDPKRKLRGITFNYINKFNSIPPDEIFRGQKERPLTILFKLGINRFNGNEYLQLQVEEINFNSL